MLGTTRQNIRHHVSSGNAPRSLDDVQGWKALLAAIGRVGTASKEIRYKTAQEKLAILKETVKAKRRQNRIADAACMDAATVNSFLKKLVAMMCAELDKIATEMPRRLVGKNEVGIYEVCQERTAEIRARFLAKHGKSK